VEPDKHTSIFKKENFEMITHETIVTERVYEILRQYLGSDVTLSPESDLLNDLGMDSLEQVELGLKLEKDFRVKIPVADLRGCITVGEVVKLVRRVAARKGVEEVIEQLQGGAPRKEVGKVIEQVRRVSSRKEVEHA
jgi:acyl carrier protein